MNLSKITRPILKGAAFLHRTALRCDCNSAHRAADRQFNQAASQLELVNAAKARLAKLQDAALEQRAAANRAGVAAYDQLRLRIESL